MHEAPKPTAQRARRRAWIVVAAAFYGSACALAGLFGGEDEGPVFPHALHIEEVDCTSCHEGAEDQAQAGFPPSENGCMLCHKDLDPGKPLEKTVAAFLVDGKPRWLSRDEAYEGDVRFDHAAHAAAEIGCESCHGTETGTENRDLRIAGGKPACLECHAKTERGTDCAVCHTTLRLDQPPPDHGALWEQIHGAHSRTMLAGTGDTTCAQCHTEDSCNQCHQLEPPQSHTNFWRRRGHGLTAAIDRTNCSVCHTEDYCDRCHETTEPLSHRGAFGPPGNRHCVTCHLPPVGLGCGACHRSFPAHPSGPPTPGNAQHMTASSPFDCLGCHVALSHANPGGDCRFCHQ